MKIILWILFLLNICSYVLATDYTQDANCVAAWTYEENTGTTTSDVSPNANNGTFKGADEPAWATASPPVGASTAYVTFDGSNDYIKTGTMGNMGQDLNTGTWTFVSYMQSSQTVRSCIMGTVNTGSSQMLNIVINGFDTENDANDDLGIVIRDSDANLTRGAMNTINVDLQIGWHHIVHTFQTPATSAINFWVDGVSKGLSAGTPIPSYAADNCVNFGYENYLGCRNVRGTAGLLYAGSLDDTAIFSRALDSTEINDIMDNGLVGSAGGVIKTYNGLAWGSVKTIKGLLAGSVKTINGAAAQ